MADGRQGLNNFLYPRFRDRLLLGNFGNLTTNTVTQNLKICYLNAGVGTQYVYSGGSAISGYAWPPTATGNDSPSSYAGYAITAFSHIPWNHRTMAASSSFGGGAITSTLTGVGVTWNGVLYADNITVYAVTAGTMVSAFVMYQYNKASGTSTTAEDDLASPLIAFFDSAIGMPVQGNGGDITVVWDTGNNRIFKI